MANTILNPSIVAKSAVRILENELVLAKKVYRAYENEFAQTVNGYKVGSTVSIRKPANFTVRSGATASVQDVTEGSTTVVVDKQIGIDFQFTSQELTLNIGELSERVIKPAMVQLANRVDRDIAALTTNVWNRVGTPGSTVNTFAKFMAGVQRMNEMAVPSDERCAVLSPADEAALVGSQTALFIQGPANDAYRNGNLGKLAAVDTYMSQNAPILTTGARGGTPLVNGAGQAVTYGSTNSWGQTQNLVIDGASNSITGWAKAGDTFTIAGVYAVNPVTKQALTYLQQFSVQADADSSGAGAVTLSISPAIITSGAFQTVSGAPADNAALTFLGSASTSYQENLMFHKNAFALVAVPMDMPQGAINVARESYKGLSVRVVPYYDGTNDISKWRLDLLYGVKAIDPRLAVRLHG